MNGKTICLTVILSICIGIAIFFLSNLPSETNPSVLSVSVPTPPPLQEDVNLLKETKKLTPDDFSLDFDKLKEEVEKF